MQAQGNNTIVYWACRRGCIGYVFCQGCEFFSIVLKLDIKVLIGNGKYITII